MKFKLPVFWLAATTTTILASVLPAHAQYQHSQRQLSCGSNAGVWVCNRKTDVGVGNHSYIWDARTRQACGTQGSSGASGTNRSEAGPLQDSCNFVPFSEGIEDKIFNHCNKNANNGVWVPGINDCHNAAQDSVEQSGLKYPGAPGGRLGDRNYSNSDSPAWVESGKDVYQRDSNGDGILDQSYDPFSF